MFQVNPDVPHLHFSVPKEHNAKEFLNDGYAHDPCNVYPVLDPNGGCIESNFGTNMTSCNGDFIYSQDLYSETLSTRFVYRMIHMTVEQLLLNFICSAGAWAITVVAQFITGTSYFSVNKCFSMTTSATCGSTFLELSTGIGSTLCVTMNTSKNSSGPLP